MRTVTLSVKNVPVDLARRLRDRAGRHHRSLQGELMAILAAAVETTTVDQVLALSRQLGLSSPAEAATLVRQDRRGRRR